MQASKNLQPQCEDLNSLKNEQDSLDPGVSECRVSARKTSFTDTEGSKDQVFDMLNDADIEDIDFESVGQVPDCSKGTSDKDISDTVTEDPNYPLLVTNR